MSDNAPAMLVEGTDYRLLPYSDDVWSVLILDGRYKDTIMLYGNVSIEENSDDEDAGELNFEIEIVESEEKFSLGAPATELSIKELRVLHQTNAARDTSEAVHTAVGWC